MNKAKRIEEIEDKINHLYNRRGKAVEYKNYDDAERMDYEIEDLEDEVLKLSGELAKEKA